MLLGGNKGTGTQLYVLDLASGDVETLPYVLPFAENSAQGTAGIGALAYDAEQNLVLFAADKQLWLAKENGECSPFAQIEQEVFAYDGGWYIGNRTYAYCASDTLYIRSY